VTREETFWQTKDKAWKWIYY